MLYSCLAGHQVDEKDTIISGPGVVHASSGPSGTGIRSDNPIPFLIAPICHLAAGFCFRTGAIFLCSGATLGITCVGRAEMSISSQANKEVDAQEQLFVKPMPRQRFAYVVGGQTITAYR